MAMVFPVLLATAVAIPEALDTSVTESFFFKMLAVSAKLRSAASTVLPSSNTEPLKSLASLLKSNVPKVIPFTLPASKEYKIVFTSGSDTFSLPPFVVSFTPFTPVASVCSSEPPLIIIPAGVIVLFAPPS